MIKEKGKIHQRLKRIEMALSLNLSGGRPKEEIKNDSIIVEEVAVQRDLWDYPIKSFLVPLSGS